MHFEPPENIICIQNKKPSAFLLWAIIQRFSSLANWRPALYRPIYDFIVGIICIIIVDGIQPVSVH
jgi:hypothetical protein